MRLRKRLHKMHLLIRGLHLTRLGHFCRLEVRLLLFYNKPHYMKKLFLIAVAIAGVVTSTFAQQSKKQFVYKAPQSINTIVVDGNVNITLVVAPNEPNVFISGNQNFTKNVETNISNGRMVVQAKTSSRSKDDMIYLYTADLTRLELNGDIQVSTIGIVDSDKLQVFINGNCHLNIQHKGNLNIALDEKYEIIKRQSVAKAG